MNHDLVSIENASRLWYAYSHIHNITYAQKGTAAMTDKNTVNITISVTREERKAMKQIALDEDISVSALIRRWLTEYQDKLKAKGFEN